ACGTEPKHENRCRQGSRRRGAAGRRNSGNRKASDRAGCPGRRRARGRRALWPARQRFHGRRREPNELANYKKGALVIAIMDPYGNDAALKAMADAGIASFAMELMPRIT